MLENLSCSAWQVLIQASRESEELNSRQTCPEHLLLALTRADDGRGELLLSRFGVDYQDIREGILDAHGMGDPSSDGSTPFSASLQELIEDAISRASMRQDKVTTHDLLWSAVRSDDLLSVQILKHHQVDVNELRNLADSGGYSEKSSLESGPEEGDLGIIMDRLGRIEYMLDIINNNISEMKIDMKPED